MPERWSHLSHFYLLAALWFHWKVDDNRGHRSTGVPGQSEDGLVAQQWVTG
jgi:hypothetical protein